MIVKDLLSLSKIESMPPCSLQTSKVVPAIRLTALDRQLDNRAVRYHVQKAHLQAAAARCKIGRDRDHIVDNRLTGEPFAHIAFAKTGILTESGSSIVHL